MRTPHEFEDEAQVERFIESQESVDLINAFICGAQKPSGIEYQVTKMVLAGSIYKKEGDEK